VFRGVNNINLDAKGRLALPARYRELIRDLCEGQLVLTIDTEESCLLLYPLGEWEQIEKKIESLPSFNRSARRIQRLLIGHATDTEMDANGRLLIASPLRQYAHLEKHVVLIGQGKKFEIWNESTWETKRTEWLDECGTDGGDLPDELVTISL
jgi:MraZ protein